jgi:hypothetical protein
VAVVFQRTAGALPAQDIRAAIAAELGMPLATDLAQADAVLTIGIDRRGQLVLSYRQLQRAVVRAIPAPEDPGERPTFIALLAGNLVRNEALELLPPGASAREREEPPSAPDVQQLQTPFPEPPVEQRLQDPFAERRSWDLVPPFPTARVAAPVVAAARTGSADRRPAGPLFLMLGLGSGVAWVRGSPDVNPNYLDGADVRPLTISRAARAAGYHLAPEAALLLGPRLFVGAQLRLQRVSGATEVHSPSCGPSGVCRPPGAALAILARVGRMQPVGSRGLLSSAASVGLGRVRHLVSLGEQPIEQRCGSGGDQPCVDTVASGLVLLGPGATFLYRVHGPAFAYAGVQLLMSIPRPMLHLDGSVGLAARL